MSKSWLKVILALSLSVPVAGSTAGCAAEAEDEDAVELGAESEDELVDDEVGASADEVRLWGRGKKRGATCYTNGSCASGRCWKDLPGGVPRNSSRARQVPGKCR